MCVLIRVASCCHLTFTTEYIHNVLKTFLPLVIRPCRFDQITRGKIKPRTEGFINHVLMAAILIFTSWKEPGQSAKTREEWGPKLDDMNLVWAQVTGFFFVCLFV